MKRGKQILLFTLTALMLTGCQTSEKKTELENYRLVTSNASKLNENQIVVENNTYDFGKDKMNSAKYKIDSTAQLNFAVVDDKGKAVLYSAKDEKGNDEVYRYDLETKKVEQLTENFWGISSIIPRENDYIVVGVPQTPNDSKVFMLWSIDRNTKEVKHIELSNDKHKDLSVWQAAYIPETDGLILQTYSESEEYALRDKWNNKENHSEGTELETPFYYYQYENGKVKYLFEKNMPQSTGLVANKNDVLFGVQSDVNGDCVYRYNLKEEKEEKVKGLERLDKTFYLDKESNYLYKFNGKIGKVDLKTGKEEWLDNQFKEYYFTDYRLVKEQ